MDDPRFTRFLMDLSEGAEGTDAGHIVESGQLCIDGIDFTFLHTRGSCADRVLIYCNFGEISEEADVNAFLDLLKCNLLMYSGGTSPAFSCLPGTRQVILISSTAIEGMNPVELLSTLQSFAANAARWRQKNWRFPETGSLRERLDSVSMKVEPLTGPDNIAMITFDTSTSPA